MSAKHTKKPERLNESATGVQSSFCQESNNLTYIAITEQTNQASAGETVGESCPRPFKCTDCSKGFRYQGHLDKHLRSKSHMMTMKMKKIAQENQSLITEESMDEDSCSVASSTGIEVPVYEMI